MGKRNRNPPPDPADPTLPNQTPFRVSERSFKRKVIPDELWQTVVSLQNPINLLPVQLPPIQHHWFADTSNSHVKAFTFKSHPGLIYIPNPFRDDAQKELIVKCVRDFSKRPNVTNLDTHYIMPQEGLWNIYEGEAKDILAGVKKSHSILERRLDPVDQYDVYEETEPSKKKQGLSEGTVKIDPPTSPTPNLAPINVAEGMKRLRWSSVGLQYHWTTKEYHMERDAPIPPVIKDITTAIVKAIESITEYPVDHYTPEAGIINFYQMGDSLTAHQDRSELNKTAPLVSIRTSASMLSWYVTLLNVRSDRIFRSSENSGRQPAATSEIPN
ncbi:hypothetical protein HDU97_009166 [Phlyctochytrium planicorne]|nr:hypothetical protein HDU97_009166 [Phlyctochytrium planicorne]